LSPERIHKKIPTMTDLKVTAEKEGKADIGVVGIGTMGSNLALNLLDKGFHVAVWNLETDVTEAFLKTHASFSEALQLLGAATYEDFARLLKTPRKVIILVTAGRPTDIVIENLMRVLSQNDVIVDTGNAHFKDQSRRAEMVEAKGLRFLGMGVSGGAEGARKGPAFFPGGTASVWEDIRPIVEAAAAKATDGRPCVTMCGQGGAGSCVKMYHNAGEYAVLQIWAEACAVMRSWGLPGTRIRQVLESWNAMGDLCSYMLDITIEVVAQEDTEAQNGSLLVDNTADMIGSKGTGLWSVQEALELGVPVPSLTQAVLARQMSMCRAERVRNADLLSSVVSIPSEPLEDTGAQNSRLDELYWAVYLSILASYAQMFQALRAVDAAYGMGITTVLPRIISTFRAGCILQGAILEPITKAFEKEPDIPNLLCAFHEQLRVGMPKFRAACAKMVSDGEPAGVIQASLVYITTMTQPILKAGQVVALQRDVFGRHGFKRLEDGAASEQLFHATWKEMIP